jgi:uncharacterized protein YbjT (DUF2867 family)
LGRIYDDKDVQERIVRSSKLDWVIVRPVIPTNGQKTSAYRALVDPRDWTCGFISRADVADFLVKEIDDDAFLHKTPVPPNELVTAARLKPDRMRALLQRRSIIHVTTAAWIAFPRAPSSRHVEVTRPDVEPATGIIKPGSAGGPH